MTQEFDIQQYMTRGVERVVNDALKATLKNPKESAFMVKFAAASVKASKRRAKAEREGEHIPPFLIAGITSACNLHCEGCYSRHNEATVDSEPVRQLTTDEWNDIFAEADELGISFILLAGGEPLLRKDVISTAAGYKNILFPIFTNGIFISDEYFDLFDKNRNLVPVMSIEGGEASTDHRRGQGVYKRLVANMDELKKRGIIFGTSVTVTNENLDDVTSDAFLKKLENSGCRAVIYVEFVPVTKESEHLALNEEKMELLAKRIANRRADDDGMVLISFPGDEKSSDGCVAAGRGFFHINSHGGAEPCPFSPYSDTNVRDTSIREAMRSKLFRNLIDGGVLKEEHKGGCTLFEKREQVENLANM